IVLNNIILMCITCRSLLILVGGSLQLDTQNPVPDFDDLFWVFNRTNNVLKYSRKQKEVTFFSHYEGRVEFNEETYSLTLKNLQKTDSGLYEAQASGDNVTRVAEYRLSVLDPVEAPVLTYQLNRDTCNITLTCRGHDLSIHSSCSKETCEEKEVTSPGGIALSLSVNGSTIICNHSNPVSWKTHVLELKELKGLCADEGKNDRIPSIMSQSGCLLFYCPVNRLRPYLLDAVKSLISKYFVPCEHVMRLVSCRFQAHKDTQSKGSLRQLKSTIYKLLTVHPQQRTV
uniref:Immunoglobulin V-set domain-containing protein n=1 Tax=Pygocentrus nattereri TaxID=42514 RepID=A0A3B4CCH7_PYGNA